MTGNQVYDVMSKIMYTVGVNKGITLEHPSLIGTQEPGSWTWEQKIKTADKIMIVTIEHWHDSWSTDKESLNLKYPPDFTSEEQEQAVERIGEIIDALIAKENT